jgi:GNAT superfamily N-acetyltransferase
MNIELATAKDIPEMVRLGSLMHKESAYAAFDFDFNKVANNFKFWVSSPDYFVAVAKDEDGNLIGGYCGYVTEYFFGKDLIACDLGLFIDPDRRGGMTAVRLIKAFEDWAQSKGAKEVCPGTTTMVAPERTSRLYERLGYKVVGSIFKKEV